MPEFEGQTSERHHACVGENPLNPSRPERTREKSPEEEGGSNVVQHEVSRPSLWVHALMGFLIMC